jgi:hypothetical protein
MFFLHAIQVFTCIFLLFFAIGEIFNYKQFVRMKCNSNWLKNRYVSIWSDTLSRKKKCKCKNAKNSKVEDLLTPFYWLFACSAKMGFYTSFGSKLCHCSPVKATNQILKNYNIYKTFQLYLISYLRQSLFVLCSVLKGAVPKV